MNRNFKKILISDIQNLKNTYTKPILSTDTNKINVISEKNNVQISESVSNIKFNYNHYTKEYSYNYISTNMITIPFVSDKTLNDHSWEKYINKVIKYKVFPINIFNVLYCGNMAYFCFKIDKVLLEDYTTGKVYLKSKRYLKKAIENIIDAFNFNLRKIYQDGILSEFEKLHIHPCKSKAKDIKLEIPIINTYILLNNLKYKVKGINFNETHEYTLDEIIYATKNTYKEKFTRYNFDNCSKDIGFSYLKRAKDIRSTAKLMSNTSLKDPKSYTLLLHAGRNAVNGGLNKRGILREIKKVNSLLGQNGFILIDGFLDSLYEKSIKFDEDIPKLTDLKEKTILEINKLNINNELDLFNGKREYLNKTEIKMLSINIVYKILLENECVNLDPSTKKYYGVSVRRLTRIFSSSNNFVKKSISLNDKNVDNLFKKYELETGISKENFISLLKNVKLKLDKRYIKIKESNIIKNYRKNIKLENPLLQFVIKKIKDYKNDYREYINKENLKYLNKRIKTIETTIDLINYVEYRGNKINNSIKKIILTKLVYPLIRNSNCNKKYKNDLFIYYKNTKSNFFKYIKEIVSIVEKYTKKEIIRNRFNKIKIEIESFIQGTRNNKKYKLKKHINKNNLIDSIEYNEFKDKIRLDMYLFLNC